MMTNVSRRWTDEERSHLAVALDAGKELAEIAFALGRTTEAIRQAPARRARIASRKQRWTPAETVRLRDMLSEGQSLAEIAVALGRSRDVIRKTAAYRETTTHQTRQVTCLRRWSAEETSYLAEARAAGKPAAEIASALGRTTGSVRSAIRANKFPSQNWHWSAQELNYLAEARAAGISAEDAAAALKRTPGAVQATAAWRAGSKQRNKRWSAEETSFLHKAIKSGTPIPAIAVALNRSENSVQCAANKAGFRTRKSAYVPDQIGVYDILCAETPNRTRRVLIYCRGCGRQEWMRLAALKYREGNGCRRCNSWANIPVTPRLNSGERAGNFVVIAVIGRKRGGWQYRVKDSRCGHEKIVTDKPAQLFHGVLSVCGCPLRITRSDGYVYWHWALPDGRPAYIGEHRIFMEQAVGRPLHPDETVHHVNGVKNDNRPENLELWSSSQPSGQRVEDKINWAVELLTRYSSEGMLGQFVRDPRLVKDILGGIR